MSQMGRRIAGASRISLRKGSWMNSTSMISSATDIQMNYMKLLVTQLQNQNPLEPLDNNDMAAQLAQFSELEQLESMNASFGQVLESVQRSYASSLIGKEVCFNRKTADGTIETKTGEVEEATIADGGTIELVVDGQSVPLTDVKAVRA
jgi:flagellar basal-body rod modification protein FlgD